MVGFPRIPNPFSSSSARALSAGPRKWPMGVRIGFRQLLFERYSSIYRVFSQSLTKLFVFSKSATVPEGISSKRGRSPSLHSSYHWMLFMFQDLGLGLKVFCSLQNNGTLAPFTQTTPLPNGISAHSATVSGNGKVYVDWKDRLYVSQITENGSIGGWTTDNRISGMDHNNHGNKGSVWSEMYWLW